MKSNLTFSIWIIAFLGFFQISNAQSPSWNWVKWSEGTETTVKSTCADASGNLYATGFFKSSTTFDTFLLKPVWGAVFIVKYNGSGAVNWAKMIHNPGYLDIDVNGITMDGDGNIYVTGTYTGTINMENKTLTGGGNFLAKYNNNGIAQWILNVSASNSVVANSTGIVVAGGKIIQKYNAAGTVIWTITGIPSNTGYTNFYSLALNSTGNILVAGDISDNWTFGTTLVTGGYQNIVLMEISSAGIVSWAKSFGNSIGGSHGQSITIDGSDNIIMTGKIGGLASATCTFGSLTLAAKNAYLVKLNSTGVTLWGKVMTNSGDITGSGVSVTTNSTGDIYVTAGTISDLNVTDGATTTFVNAMKRTNAFILKFNSSGVFQSALTNKELTSPYINACGGKTLTSSTAGVYFGGKASPYSEWGNIKATSSYGSVFAKIDGSSAGSVSFENSKNNVCIYPNPAKDILTIETKKSYNFLNKTNIFIINQLGDLIFQTEMKEQITNLNMSDYSKGIYFLQLQDSEGIITKKIVVE